MEVSQFGIECKDQNYLTTLDMQSTSIIHISEAMPLDINST